jgi:hypothetical protein
MRLVKRFLNSASIRPSDASSSASLAANSTGKSDQGLERSEKRFGFWENVCGLGVVAGVGLEYGPKLIFFIHAPTWENFVNLSGGLLIALGVAGEVLFASLAAGKRDQLRDRNIRRVAELNLQAEQERLARVRIEQSIAMRNLSGAQRAALIEGLSAFSENPSKVIVVPRLNEDFESFRFCGLLTSALQAAGLRTNWLPSGNFMQAPIVQGLYALATPDSESQQLCAGIATSLITIGVDVTWWGVSQEGSDTPFFLSNFWPEGLYDERGGRMVLIVVMQQPKPELDEKP